MPLYAAPAKSPDFPALERKMLDFWARERIFEQLRERNAGGEPFRFLDGPITANNPMGVHHAWGRSLKDMFQRYHAMNGRDQRHQNGFDCQGLWVEVEVEKELGFTSKKDIEAYGVAKFVEACKARVEKFAKVQTDQSIRLGYWMDWDNSYYTMSPENNYTIWGFLKRCHERGLVYRGEDAMPWCPRCGIGLSQMELHEGYRLVEHLSLFVELPLLERDGESLIVWTTTPWTLPANVAAAVNPEMTYLRVRAGEGDAARIFYIGKENYENVRTAGDGGPKPRKLQSIQAFLKQRGGEPEILGEVKGADMVGWRYRGPFDHFAAAQQADGERPSAVDAHRVIPWDEVSGAEGTGIVHIAPGCGREDNALGREHNLAILSPLTEDGRYIDGFGELSGRPSIEVAEDVAADLKSRGLLVGREKYPHRYPHCWRCKTETVYRLVDEWFIDMSWREEIQRLVPQIRWIPEFGERLEAEWLRNMGDWMISKKRYWGLALPIWVDEETGDFEVIGSYEELKERAVEGWDVFEGNTPHRPYVDAVKIRNPKTGNLMSRIRDVGNPWLDAGIVAFSTLGYNQDREYWRRWFPADLVLECFPGQFRNWFYALLAMTTMMQDEAWADRTGGDSAVEPPFRTLLGHALVKDEHGKDMHKSAGNAIEFNQAAEAIGAEIMRYIYAGQNATANLNFPNIRPDRDPGAPHLDQEVYRKLLTWWNCYSFYLTYAEVDGVRPAQLDVPLAERTELDRWIVSKLQGLVMEFRGAFEGYTIWNAVPRFEAFLDDLSGWYLRRSRRRFWKSEDDQDKLAAFTTLYEVLHALNRLMAPVLPFLTEEMHQTMTRGVDDAAPASVHLCRYPEADPGAVDRELETRIDALIAYKNLGLRLRNEANIKIRQPLGRILIAPATPDERRVLERADIREQLLEEINVKALELVDDAQAIASWTVRPEPRVHGPKAGKNMGAVTKHLGEADAGAVRAAIDKTGGYAVPGVDDLTLTRDDLVFELQAPEHLAAGVEGHAFAALDVTLTDELRAEGHARDLIRVIQNLRKSAALNVTDRIAVAVGSDDASILAAVDAHRAHIANEVLAESIETGPGGAGQGAHEAAERAKIGGAKVDVGITRAAVGEPS